MSQYYLGGYYLIKKLSIDFGSLKAKTVFTGSSCINDNLLGNWSYSWASDNNADIKNIYNDFLIDGIKTMAIRNWVDEKFESKDIQWGNVFSNIETAVSYRHTFFSHLNDIIIIGLYFNESEANALIKNFEEDKIGLYQNLIKKILEKKSENETTIGFDLIGIEQSGDFHTFYCHDISQELINKFGISINNYGLINDHASWESLLDYMNDEETGLEPVPWYLVKIKLINY